MSTSQLQNALVNLVRYPELNRGEKLEEFLARYDLTEKEQWQVRSLASSYYVAKFGRDQRATRFDLNARGILPLTGSVVGYRLMARDIYGIRFEPNHEGLAVGELSIAFAQFFIESAGSLASELDLPDYIGDLAKYEFAEYRIKGPSASLGWKPSERSLLRADVPLVLTEFQHDMVELVERLKKTDEDKRKSIIAEKKPTIVLFTRFPKREEPGTFTATQFEIDETLKDFLLGQMSETAAQNACLPPCYGDLVALVICDPVN